MIRLVMLGVTLVIAGVVVFFGQCPSDNVLVVGAGLIGQFAAQACRALGARVAIAGYHDDRLALAAELGADVTVNTNEPDGLDRLQKLAPFSVVMETTGADALGWIIGEPGKPVRCMVGRRSRVVMIGGQREVRYSYLRAGANQVALLHTGHFQQVDMEQVVRLVQKGTIRIQLLIRDVAPRPTRLRSTTPSPCSPASSSASSSTGRNGRKWRDRMTGWTGLPDGIPIKAPARLAFP